LPATDSRGVVERSPVSKLKAAINCIERSDGRRRVKEEAKKSRERSGSSKPK